MFTSSRWRNMDPKGLEEGAAGDSGASAILALF